MGLAYEYEERLIQVAGHAIGKVLECYKRRQLKPQQLERMKKLETVAQYIELLSLRPVSGALIEP